MAGNPGLFRVVPSEPGVRTRSSGGVRRDRRSLLCGLQRKFPVIWGMYRDFARLAGFRGVCGARNPRFVRRYSVEFPA
jgi:hypothetical protein